jgi:hypothetical protein
MSGVKLTVLRFVHTVASVFWAGDRVHFAGNALYASTNEGLFSSIVYKKLKHITVFLLLSALAIALIHFWGVPLKEIMVGIVAMTLYAVLIAVHLLRFILIFLGVFTVYRILQERHNAQSII